jgi:DNA-binding LacI/PurR family transcriptional regulator
MFLSDDVELHIRQLIADRSLSVGARLPSERKLAAMWNVSYSTANRTVIRLLAKGVLQRQGYKLCVGPAALVASSTLPIHCFCNERSVLKGVQRIASLQGHGVVISGNMGPESLRSKLLTCREPGTTAGILMWNRHELDLLGEFRRVDVPAVVIGQPWPGHSYVAMDSRASGALAVRHLAELGHERLAFIGLKLSSTDILYDEAVTGFTTQCEALGLEKSALCTASVRHSDKMDDVRKTWRRLRKQLHISALVCQTYELANVLLKIFAEENIRIPNDLSLILCEEDPRAVRCAPPLTTCSIDMDLAGEVGALLLFSEIRQSLKRRRASEPSVILFEPFLIHRDSTVPLKGRKPDSRLASDADSAVNETAATSFTAQVAQWPLELKKRRALAASINARSFPALPKTDHLKYVPLDISGLANRSLHRQNSWLGHEPFRYISSGLQKIHGVPFQIIDEEKNRGLSAVVLRSAKAHSSHGEELPKLVTLPVQSRVKAIYLLHACGWAIDSEPFATYEFAFSKSIVKVKVIACGRLEAGDRPSKLAIVQDWHPSCFQFHSRHVLPYVITGEDPLAYSRFLYSFEWINPYPNQLLQEIRMRTLSPDSITTLGLLAATAVTFD